MMPISLLLRCLELMSPSGLAPLMGPNGTRIYEIPENRPAWIVNCPATVGEVDNEISQGKDFHTPILESILREEKRVLDGCSKIVEDARFVQSCLEQYGGEQVTALVRSIRSLGLVDAFCDASMAAAGSESASILDSADWASTSLLSSSVAPET